MEKTDKAEVAFFIGMYTFMIATAGIAGYELIKLSKIFLNIVSSK